VHEAGAGERVERRRAGAGGHHDVRALGAQRARDGEADALAAAGDDGGLSGEFEFHTDETRRGRRADPAGIGRRAPASGFRYRPTSTGSGSGRAGSAERASEMPAPRERRVAAAAAAISRITPTSSASSSMW